MAKLDYDYFIVGQGLAGSILAWQLEQRGQSVCVIDNAHYGSASMVAAGIINPITGHRLNINRNFELHYQIAQEFYREFEQENAIQCFQEIPQYRLIKNPGQKDYLNKRQQQREYQDYLGRYLTQYEPFSVCTHGVIEIFNTAIVDTQTILNMVSQWLENNHKRRTTSFEYDSLTIHDDRVEWQNLKASAMIFCQGYQAIHNPWLKSLPFKLAKGEILTLECPNDWPQALLNWGTWLAPARGHNLRLGANYAWRDCNLSTSEKIQQDLLQNLTKHLSLTPTLLDHQAGIRPTTQDRQVFIGAVSDQPRLFCFNGFGSKGCLSIPYYARLFCDHLIHQKPLDPSLTRWL